MTDSLTPTHPLSVRRRLRVAVMCWPSNQDPHQGAGREVIATEVGPTAIRFTSEHIYPVGSALLADIYLPSRKGPVRCTLEVMTVEAVLNQESYSIVAVFSEIAETECAAIGSMLEKLDLYQWLDVATRVGATDVHLTVGRPPMMRRGGRIGPLAKEPIRSGEIEAMLYPLLTEAQIRTFEAQREMDFSFSPTLDSRFRVNMHWQRGFVEAALRNIPTQVKSFSELSLPVGALEHLCSPQSGLVLIAGATGSGKTTTMSSMIDHINSTQTNIIVTIEAPIEYLHVSKHSVIKQRELGADTLSFREALKRVLRQDPDVICVGELLDGESLMAAMRAAETGHLVISTIHAPDAIQAVQRAVNFFPPEHAANLCQQLSMSLVGVLFQTLIPAVSGDRVPATELLLNNSAMANLIREGKFSMMRNVLQTSRVQGMHTLQRSLEALYKRGLIASPSRLSSTPPI